MDGLVVSTIITKKQILSCTGDLAHYLARSFVVFLILCLPSQGLTFETHGMKGPKNPFPHTVVETTEPTQSTTLAALLLGSVRFFQKQISPIDGPRCSFSPTCSQFGYEAVHDHGPVLGVVMTADRLMRCNYWTEEGLDYNRLSSGALYDPVANNLLKKP